MIKKIIYILCIVSLASCAETETENHFINGNEKTPVDIRISCQDGNVGTRAYDNTFEEADDIYVYLRHIIKNGENNFSPVNGTGTEPKLVTLKVISAGSSLSSNANNLSVVDPALGLYWDDFSAGGIGDSTHIRTQNHALQSYYGYCFNGREKNNYLQESKKHNGEITWAVDLDQRSNFKTNDLLWSFPTDVTYNHGDSHDSNHGDLNIKFFHAMSKITVHLKGKKGFDENAFNNTTVTLKNVNTQCTLTPSEVNEGNRITDSNTTADVTMDSNTASVSESTPERIFFALIAPGTVITEGTELAVINGVDNNNYSLKVNSNIFLQEAWGKDHTVSGSSPSRSITTKPGYHYYITVDVNKSEITTVTTLENWSTVNATGTGDIIFDDDGNDENLVFEDATTPEKPGDIKIHLIDKDKFQQGSEFSLFDLQKTEENSTDATKRTNHAYQYVTVPKFTEVNGEQIWVNNPELYWPNKTVNYFFRALAKYMGKESDKNKIEKVGALNSDKGVAISQGKISEGKDIIWGTTAKHYGKHSNFDINDPSTYTTYQRGQAIPPRTGDVPMAFEHITSKISVSLETSKPANEGDPTPANAVDLDGAKISISNLYTSGTVNIEDGSIALNNTISSDAIKDYLYPITDYIVMPHVNGLPENAKITITLKDGTTYSLLLKSCKVMVDGQPNGSVVDKWNPGRHYSYVIKLTKEDISFRALIKNWEETSVAGGDATLEW